MAALTDVFIEPKPDRTRQAKNYWDQRSILMLSARLRLNTARVTTVILEQAALGSLWVPCRPHDEDVRTAYALCTFLNSSIGALVQFGGRAHNVLSRAPFSIDAQRSIPVPNFPALGDGARDVLAAAYELLKDEVLLPFPQMNDDPIRKQLDDAVTDALDLDPEWVAQIRRALSEEPSITNRRYTGVGE